MKRSTAYPEDIVLSIGEIQPKRTTLIKTFPRSDPKSEYLSMSPERLLSSFEIDDDGSLTCIIFEYVLGNEGRQFEELKSYAEFFVLVKGIPQKNSQLIQIGEIRVAWSRPSHAKYLYGLPDTDGEPARITNGKILAF